jgi:hypothetical protein
MRSWSPSSVVMHAARRLGRLAPESTIQGREVGGHHPEGVTSATGTVVHIQSRRVVAATAIQPVEQSVSTCNPTQAHPKRVMSTTRSSGRLPSMVHCRRRDLSMADDVSQYRSASRAGEDTSGWAAGFALFAALMMIMAGVWQGLAGLIAIFENEFYITTRNYIFEFDATTWGWIHLLVGVVVGLAGLGLMAGQTWARVVGIVLAVLSAITNFLFIPYYPFWSMLIIAVDVFVIWALAAHGRELRGERY